MIDVLALASDYDETLACKGQVDPPTWNALHEFKASGRNLILVTGRELDDLLGVCGNFDLFDAVVAENGAVLHLPSKHQSIALAGPPRTEFVEALRQRGVHPLSVGHSIVATERSQYEILARTIRELAPEMHIICNRASLMALPFGTNKRSGLQAALRTLKLPAERVVGIGDAENDEAFLDFCGVYAVVANALPELKQAADIIAGHECGPGVVEIVQKIMAGQLALALR